VELTGRSDWREGDVVMALQEMMRDGKCSQSFFGEIRNRERERDHL
jgi:hypothetical protein